jgi:hypothetical protein
MTIRVPRRAAQPNQYDVPVELEAPITRELARALLAGFIRYILFSRSQAFATVDQMERSHEVRGVARGRVRCRSGWCRGTCWHPRAVLSSTQDFLEMQAQSKRKRVPASQRKIGKVGETGSHLGGAGAGVATGTLRPH